MSPLLTLAERSIARPRLTIALLGALVAAMVPGLFRLELRTDGHALVPPHDPAIATDAEIRERFDLRDPIVVHLSVDPASDDARGVYRPETLERLVEVTERLARLDGVGPEHVTSLATERRDRVEPGTLRFLRFLEPVPRSDEELATLRADVDAVGILTGTLISADGRSAVVLVGAPNLPPERAARDRSRIDLYERVVDVVADLRADLPADESIDVVGAPVAESLLGLHLLEDLRVLVPLSLAVIALVLAVGCRRLHGVLIGIVEIGACQVVVLGAMGWLGVPISLPTAILPVLITTIGLADEIHILWRHQDLLERADPSTAHRDVVRRTMSEMVRPVGQTSLTTAIGFLSFTLSPIEPVRSLGAFAALGVLVCLLWSLTVVPATMALLPAGALHRRRTTRSAGARLRAPDALGRRRGLVLALLGAATVVLALGVTRLAVQDSWLDGFAPGSPFRLAADRLDARFFGAHQLVVEVDLGATLLDDVDRLPLGRVGPLLSPTALRALDRFEGEIRELPAVGGVLGPASHLRTVRHLWLARRAGARQLPATSYDIQSVVDRFDLARGEAARRRVIDDALRRVAVTVFLPDANYRDTAELVRSIDELARQILEPLGASRRFAGDVAVSQTMIPAIVETQIRSLLLAFVGALVVVCLLKRSIRLGVAAVAPALVAVLWVFGAMGWLGIPLGVATSMVCAITLGVGVDYGIHWTDRLARARETGRRDPARRALVEAGPAITADALAVALGFGLLAVSQVPANARLGLLVALALSACCLLTLAGLGAMFSRPSKPPSAPKPGVDDGG